jgi:hypothetical protein
MRWAFAVVPLLFACKTNYNRAALVPHATPRMTTGQPLSGRALFSAGASSIAHLGDPQKGDTPNQGIEIPGTQFFGSLKGGIGDIFSFGLLYENGLDKGAKKINSSQPDVDNGNVQGWGMSLDFVIPIDERFKIGVGVDAMLWSCPYQEFSTTAGGQITIEQSGTDTVSALAGSITPSYKIDKDVVLFGGLTVRNHPTIDQKGMGTTLDSVEVDSGPGNYIVSAGVEGSVANGSLLLSAMAYYDISRDPAKYGPGMAAMISVPLGKKHPPQPQQPPPGYIYAPPGYPNQPPPPGYPGPMAPPMGPPGPAPTAPTAPPPAPAEPAPAPPPPG